MKIVLDTNQLHGDYLLESPQFSTLHDGLRQAGDELCVPEVVVKEITRKFMQAYAGAISGQKKVNRVAGLVGNEQPELVSVDIAEKKYSHLLADRLKQLSARVLDVPNVGVGSLLDRDLAERRPFDNKGRGLRDTLIWESILKDLEDHEEDVVLITNDAGFTSRGTEKGTQTELHGDLADDLEAAGHNRTRVKVFKTIQDFNSEVFSRLPEKIYAEDDALEGTFVEALDPDQMRDQFTGDIEDEIAGLLPWIFRTRGAWDAEVSFLSWVGVPRIVEAFNLGDERAHVVVRTQALFDTKFRVDQDEFTPLSRYFVDKTVFPSDMRWDAEMQVFRYEARVLLFTDIVYRWNLESNSSEGAAVLRFGFDEDDMRVM